MSRKSIHVLLGLMFIVTLAGCGKGEENKDIKGDFDPTRIQQELKKEVTAPELSVEYLKKFDEEFINSKEYNPIYRNTRFLVNDVSVHIPYTARGFEKLFDTEFVYATDVNGKGKKEEITFYDRNYNFITVQYNATCEYVDKSDMTLEEKLDLPIQNFEFGEWQDFPQVYKNGHPDDYNDIIDVDKHSLFAVYNIVFQDPDEYDSGILKCAGYGYAIVPVHYMAIKEYVAGTLPEECYAKGVKRFSEYFDNPEDEELYSEEKNKPLMYCIGDVTCDGIDELAIIDNDSNLDIYVYDRDDMCIRNIWSGSNSEKECKINKGTLMFYDFVPESSTTDMDTEDIKYYVLDTKGNTVLSARLNMHERATHVNLMNEEENEYAGEWYINGNSVSRPEYIEAGKILSIPADLNVFSKYEESMFISFLSTDINVYLNHSGYEYTTWNIAERRAQLKLDDDKNISEEMNEQSGQKPGDTNADLYIKEIKKLYSAGMADSFALIEEQGKAPYLVAVSSDGFADGDDDAFLYMLYNGEPVLLKEEIVDMFGCFLEISEDGDYIYSGGGDVNHNEGIDEITGKELNSVFSGEISGDLDDTTGEYTDFYKIEGKDVSKTDYYDAIFKYLNRTYIRIECDGLHYVDYSYDGDELICNEKQNVPYLSFDDIIAKIEKKNGDKSDPWKAVYKDYLYRVIDGQELVPDILEAVKYNPEMGIRFEIKDITGDDTPELFVSGQPYSEESPVEYWHIYSMENGKESFLGEMSFYDPEKNLVYVNNGSSFEGYVVYRMFHGRLTTEYEIGEGDAEGQETPYYRKDGEGESYNISEQEMDNFKKEFESGLKKYGISGTLLTKENVDKKIK